MVENRPVYRMIDETESYETVSRLLGDDVRPLAYGIKRSSAYSPSEFAELFGKSQTWGYRQIYAGKVNAITEHGRVHSC